MRERRIFFLFDFSAVLGYNYLIKPRRNSMNNDIRTEEQETVSGIVDSIIYQNEDNGYVVFEMEEIVLWQRRFLSLMMKSLL